MSVSVYSMLFACILTVLSIPSVVSWRAARATRYGGLEDFWSIHDGSCWHSYLGWDVKTGWDVAAMADKFPEYSESGYCGMCLEVRCRNADFSDGYGQNLDRNSACYDSSASVIVQITDVCPCEYPTNAYSNKRWCCGDIPHIDLSDWAFEKLAEKKWGVIGIEYQVVPCGQRPAREARLPPGQSPSPGYAPPNGWDSARHDPRPWPGSSSTSFSST